MGAAVGRGLDGGQGVEQVGASRAGLFIHLMPAFGILLAAAFLGERLAGYHLVGIALIFFLLGVALSFAALKAGTLRWIFDARFDSLHSLR